MYKILTVIGARPQIIKAAAISRAVNGSYSDRMNEVIVHTGQHYDENMSEVFFNELGIPRPDHNLGVGSGGHGEQTAAMIEKLEAVIKQEQPNCVVVYGDTNSTLAAAIAASKIHVPVVHVEAGLRSFNKRMPEEINRIMCDHVSTLLFSPTRSGVDNLQREGFALDNDGPYHIDNPKVYHCGDIMYDNSKHFSQLSEERSSIIADLGLSEFVLATVHRNDNTDDAGRLHSIMSALARIGEERTVVLPAHPRTVKCMEALDPTFIEEVKKHVRIIPPVSFLDMIALESKAELIVTDSGGVQKEAFFFKKACIILRPQTEWIELVENGNAIIADADESRIMDAFRYYKSGPELSHPDIYGDGAASEFICSSILQELS